MLFLYILLGVAALLGAGAYVCYMLAYYSPPREQPQSDEERLPPGRIYEPYYPVMRQWLAQVAQMPHLPLSVQTADGLTLRGRYYEYTPDSPVEILFHGYRGYSDRDMCGAVQRCFAVGHSALLVDQRAGGASDGHVITFGVRESDDVPLWVGAVAERFGDHRKVILAGVSMGATTVLLAAERELPPQVAGVLADCGYSRAREIIKKVIRQMHLPANLLYPLVRLGALLFGRFDPNRADAVEAMKQCRLPVLFFHGDTDDFVPCEMSRQLYAACTAPKELVITPGAGHGLCYPVDTEAYIEAVRRFDSAHWQ